jgi:hypothetical protein
MSCSRSAILGHFSLAIQLDHSLIACLMSVLDKKDRMVSFRLSGSEYAAAEITCRQQGVRSVSSLARDATLKISRAHRGNRLVSDPEILVLLQHQVRALRAQIDQIWGVLGIKPAAAAQESSVALPPKAVGP